MKVAVLKERHAGEPRVSVSPDTVKRLAGAGVEVSIESGAGLRSGILDDAYEKAGATIADGPVQALAGAGLVFKVRRPVVESEGAIDELSLIPDNAILIGLLDPYADKGQFKAYAQKRLTVLSMELVPRISRAQSVDALSSQANLAGYKAVFDACIYFKRALPLMMTAAGTVAPARVLILGAGVAGLQAIATARRLGAVVSAFDVRPAVKQQVESLGASFVEVEGAGDAETAGGYAKEMDEEYRARQAQAIETALARNDICITTARIPGAPAPLLITEAMIDKMKPGSVIVDLAVEDGGNCALSQPGQVVQTNHVTIVGFLNVAGRLATDASALYARNLYNLVEPFLDRESGDLTLDFEDEIIAGCCVMRNGLLLQKSLLNGEDG